MGVEIPECFLEILDCPDCRKGAGLNVREEDLLCTLCSREFSPVDGLFRFLPTETTPLPAIYQDKSYTSFMEKAAQWQDYLYESRGPVPFVQNAGHRQLAAWRRPGRYQRMLDLGCGCGVHYHYIPEGDINAYFGLDYDVAALKKCQGAFPSATVARGDAFQLPFKSAAFDHVFSVYNLEHLVYLDEALEEICRIMTDDGDFFVSIPTEGGLGWGLGRALTTARQWSGKSLDYQQAMPLIILIVSGRWSVPSEDTLLCASVPFFPVYFRYSI